ncbi:hypothetical protein MNBD_NITROSPINAE03-664 [hydrothermal vent metagenome]|uniref:Stress-response A/B barrel domain-containing protein n=1 Tax=hydrothermal vent metagenome TaxID=652676 RepID=A0A3B1CKH7_9ZZZZ
MIRHIVLFKLKPNITKQEVEGLTKGLNGLKESIKQVRALTVEMDVGGTPSSCDLALDALFDNMADVKTYSESPAHIEIVKMVERLCESRMKIDYQIKDASL